MTQLLRFGLKKKRVGLVGLRYVTCSLMEGTPLTEISNRKYLSLPNTHSSSFQSGNIFDQTDELYIVQNIYIFLTCPHGVLEWVTRENG